MRSLNRQSLLALTAAVVLAGCSSTPDTTEPTTTTTPEPVEETTSSTATTTGAGDRAGVEVTSEAKRQAEKMQKLLNTRTFYFDFDKSVIKPDAYDSLKAHAKYIQNNPMVEVRMEGHADERGTREYNMALGERRANAVAKFLRVNGVDSSKLEIISYGEEKPVALGKDEASYALNRRVELVYRKGAPSF